MQIGIIALERMGYKIARRLTKADHTVVRDQNPAAVQPLSREKAIGAPDLGLFVRLRDLPRAVRFMLPASDIKRTGIARLAASFTPEDVVIEASTERFPS